MKTFFQSSLKNRVAVAFAACALLLLALGLYLCGSCAHDKSDRSAKVHPRASAAASPAPSQPQPPLNSEVLRRLCEEDRRHSIEAEYDEVDVERRAPGALRQVASGIGNSARLLQVAKELTLASLQESAAQFDSDGAQLRRASQQINAVTQVVLDESLGNSAEVDDERPTEIRIGPGYALYLTQDEEALFLLGHELMHVAAMNDNLRPLIAATAERAEKIADVHPSAEQEEDLTCDYIGEQVLKRFLLQHPGKESLAGRFARALDYDCDAVDEEQDEEHLGSSQTMRALLALDPELAHLIVEH